MLKNQLVFAVWLAFCGVAAAHAVDNPDTQAIRAALEQRGDTAPRRVKAGGAVLADAVAELYAQRGFAPAWTDRKRVEQLLTALAGTAGDGLDPEEYHLTPLQQGFAGLDAQASPAQRAELDLLATDAYLRALLHLLRGKVDSRTLDPRWNFSLREIAPEQALHVVNEALDSNGIAALFQRARPDNPLYRNLRNGLTLLRMQAARGGWPVLPAGGTLKPGMSDARIPLLRQRLLPGSPASQDTVYDDALVAAVRRFQREQNLEPDGVLGAGTQAALQVPVQGRIDQMRVNLERGRWLLHEVPGDFVMVDIAGYKIWFFRDGKPVWNARVQVGKPYRSTPVFKSRVDVITFNPTWTVPPTIFNEDILPYLYDDADYLTRSGIGVYDGAGRRLDPEQVNWDRPGHVVLRQAAGRRNPLGRVAIRFPNAYSIYLHDTPHRDLFERGQRATSSGCIRVERPLELVELLMNDAEKWNRGAIDAMIGAGKTRNVSLAHPVPILLMYWTVDVVDGHDIGFRPDIYKRDAGVLKALDAKAQDVKVARQPGVDPLNGPMPLHGLFTHSGTRATFFGCETGLRLDVDSGHSAAFDALEHAYRVQAPAPGASILARVSGRFEIREGAAQSLRIDRFERLVPGANCGSAETMDSARWEARRRGQASFLSL